MVGSVSGLLIQIARKMGFLPMRDIRTGEPA